MLNALPMMLRTLLVMCVLWPTLAAAQSAEGWTLERCIRHAIDHNIQVRQAALQHQSTGYDRTQAFMAMLPDLNGGVSYGANFGRTIDPGTNQFVTETVNSNNYFLSTNVTLFNGFALYNTFRQSQLSQLAAEMDLEAAKNDLALSIATGFMQIMFNEELLEVARNQMAMTEAQVDRTRKLVEVGAMAEGNLFEAEAQLANDRLQVVNGENRLNASLLQMRQMLNLTSEEAFVIVRPKVELPVEDVTSRTVNDIYTTALDRWPQVKARQQRIKAADKGINMAMGYMMPQLTANFSMSTLYSSAYQEIVGYDTANLTAITKEIPYSNQMDNNFSQRLGINLNIPIFNGLQARTGLRKARLTRENADLQLRDTQNQLYQSVQQAYNDAQAGKRQLEAGEQSLAATQKAFEYARQRFDAGALNPYDFNTSKNNLARVQSDVLRAKYDYIFRAKVLDFYMGKGIGF
jgi:outer membrane protein